MSSNLDLVRLSLKVWNSAMGVGGIATTMYAILMFRVSQVSSSSDHHNNIPWFFHGFLFVGIVLCSVTCLGHLAAQRANNCCLSIYIVVILLLLILEIVIMTEAFLDPKWEKEVLPVNLSNSFDDFTDFLVSPYIWKSLASLVFLIQAICVLLAALSIHKTNGVDGHESEYEDDEPRLAFLDTISQWQRAERRIAIL